MQPLVKVAEFALLKKFPSVIQGVSNRHTEQLQPQAVRADQPHGKQYAWVSKYTSTVVPHVDALLTRESGFYIRAGVHDCVPIIVYDAQSHSGGVIHAGFKGTMLEILKQVLTEFNPKSTYVCIGPAIGACCYNDIDIQLENVQQAIDMGVPEEQIEIMQICTKCNNNTYYSHRAGDNTNFGIYFGLTP